MPETTIRAMDFVRWRDDSALHELLRRAADPPTPAALQALLDRCATLEAFGAFDQGGALIGTAFWHRVHDEAVEIEYLAVLTPHRGLGTELVRAVQQACGAHVIARTDDDALEFYRRRGFICVPTATDPRWPQTPRFLCLLPCQELLATQPKGPSGFELVEGFAQPGIVEIHPPQERWPEDFARLRALIERALGDSALAIEHVGSTAVSGLPAKNVIDVVLLVADSDAEERYVPSLQDAGLLFWHREPGWYAHRMFRPRPQEYAPVANIHVFSLGSTEPLRMLLFRDYLRTHHPECEAYAATKRKAAERLALLRGDEGEVMEYNRFKEPFIRELGARIQASAGLPRGPRS
ncbi:bifunctional GNAT family N-acetyltransferase/GrpB family protein [Glutamicibacter sp. PS]|uniref:bifunctional GNAT family N-acetyltransferase/GrpB family protein n=1 Tax=Glutamicibacter sp. PS TaxID=3075634 RepID=UPI0028448489|nr:bifunctional GNAT family N-acetyltransferase/GrpB family protein [Glutamicibacter sp. PS]MDR4532119.1 GNAT family N-acetyltransferase [Glutamicibacter sp. PS]